MQDIFFQFANNDFQHELPIQYFLHHACQFRLDQAVRVKESVVRHAHSIHGAGLRRMPRGNA